MTLKRASPLLVWTCPSGGSSDSSKLLNAPGSPYTATVVGTPRASVRSYYCARGCAASNRSATQKQFSDVERPFTGCCCVRPGYRYSIAPRRHLKECCCDIRVSSIRSGSLSPSPVFGRSVKQTRWEAWPFRLHHAEREGEGERDRERNP